MKTRKCNVCGDEFSVYGVATHEKSCTGKHVTRTQCIHCGKEFDSHIPVKNHESRCKLNPGRRIQTCTPDGHRRKVEAARKQVWDDSRREAHSEIMRAAVSRNPDSYTSSNVCGRVKIQEYNGSKFHGQWEVDVAQWLDSQGVRWIREVQPVPYEWNGKWHLYFPDFYLPVEDMYIEVKGYQTARDVCKWKHVHNLCVISKKEIDMIRSGTYNMSSLEIHHDKLRAKTPLGG